MKTRCPICGKEISADKDRRLNPYRPFCSARCRWIDLGNWLDGVYSLEMQEKKESDAELPEEPPESNKI
jgi:hypothetical protein